MQMAVLICTVGPPCSLNLRNLTWHGFVSAHEFAPSFLSLLLALMASVAKFVVNAGFSLTLKPRPLLRLDTVPDEFFDFGHGSLIFPSLPDFVQDSEEDIRDLFQTSAFVIPSSLQTLLDTVSSLKSVETVKYVSKLSFSSKGMPELTLDNFRCSVHLLHDTESLSRYCPFLSTVCVDFSSSPTNCRPNYSVLSLVDISPQWTCSWNRRSRQEIRRPTEPPIF